MTQLKHCPRCNTDKPLTSFSGNKGRYDRKQTYCKVCYKIYDNAWRIKNPEKTKRMSRKQNLKFCFGMSLDDYDQMYIAQGGLCAICKRPESIPGSSLSVDHNHVTKTVRKLLCRNCNSTVGFLEGLNGAAILAYLEEWAGK